MLPHMNYFPIFQAGNGGAIFSLWSDHLTVTGGSRFEGSVASLVTGGAISVSDAISSVTIRGASFHGNTCNNTKLTSSAGGAVRGG